MDAYGIKNRLTGLWFHGFGPAPDYEPLWVADPLQACYVGTKESAEAQAYLLERNQTLSEVLS